MKVIVSANNGKIYYGDTEESQLDSGSPTLKNARLLDVSDKEKWMHTDSQLATFGPNLGITIFSEKFTVKIYGYTTACLPDAKIVKAFDKYFKTNEAKYYL